MQTCSSIKENSKAARLTQKRAASHTSSEMRWKLYNNPYYYACVANSAKNRAASGHEEPTCAITPAADRWELDKFHAQSPFHINKAELWQYSHDLTLKTSASVKMHHLGTESFSAAMKEGLYQDLSKGAPAASRRSSKKFPRSVRKNVDQLRLVSDSGMVNAMQRELQKVWVQVQELEEACIWARMEINNLHLRVDSKGKSWPSKVYTKLAAKVLSFREDAAQESQSQQQLQMHINSLEKQLAESKRALTKAKKDMIKERKGREVLELICAELAREIRQDKLDLDEPKQDRPHCNHQAEAEGKILRMSEEWREEKVQVKVTEAKFEVAHSNLSIGSFEQKLKDFLATTTRRGKKVLIQR